MIRWRRFLVAAWLALAVVAGQQLVLLHALGHAAERIANKDADTSATCKLHFACSQLGSAVGAKPVPALAAAIGSFALAITRDLSVHAAPIVAFHSRGPPPASV
jgi:hypothetical protein